MSTAHWLQFKSSGSCALISQAVARSVADDWDAGSYHSGAVSFLNFIEGVHELIVV